MVIFFYCYIYSKTRGGKDFNFSIYCFFSVPRQTNTHSHAHTHPVLISIPSPRVTTSPFGGGGDCNYDDDSGDDDGLHPGMAALHCSHPRALSLAPAPKTANLNLRSFLFSFFFASISTSSVLYRRHRIIITVRKGFHTSNSHRDPSFRIPPTDTDIFIYV